MVGGQVVVEGRGRQLPVLRSRRRGPIEGLDQDVCWNNAFRQQLLSQDSSGEQKNRPLMNGIMQNCFYERTVVPPSKKIPQNATQAKDATGEPLMTRLMEGCYYNKQVHTKRSRRDRLGGKDHIRDNINLVGHYNRELAMLAELDPRMSNSGSRLSTPNAYRPVTNHYQSRRTPDSMEALEKMCRRGAKLDPEYASQILEWLATANKIEKARFKHSFRYISELHLAPGAEKDRGTAVQNATGQYSGVFVPESRAQNGGREAHPPPTHPKTGLTLAKLPLSGSQQQLEPHQPLTSRCHWASPRNPFADRAEALRWGTGSSTARV